MYVVVFYLLIDIALTTGNQRTYISRDVPQRPPSLQLKLLKGEKGDMYWFFPGKMLLCISALHWAR